MEAAFAQVAWEADPWLLEASFQGTQVFTHTEVAVSYLDSGAWLRDCHTVGTRCTVLSGESVYGPPG